MSLEAILAAIEASGEAERARWRVEAEQRAQHIRDEAERRAAIVREEARRAAIQPAAGERARRLYQARQEALHRVGETRARLVEAVLAETHQRLAHLRADPDYPSILRRLLEEAVSALGEEEQGIRGCQAFSDEARNNGQALLEADPRDEALLRRLLDERSLGLPMALSLDGWGGVVIRSGDRRIVVINTLEARLERATPFLRRELSTVFESEAHSLESDT